MLSLIGVERPQESGRLILMTIRHLEIQGLLQPAGCYDREAMRQLLYYYKYALFVVFR